MNHHPSGLVQAIAVMPAGHLDTCAAVATASALAMLRADPDNPAWTAWLAGRFTKSVRRISRPSQWDRLMQAVESLRLETTVSSSGEAIAMAFAPMTYEDMPRELRSLQVSGLDRERTPRSEPTPRADPIAHLIVPDVRLAPSAAMTTGKAAAQAAHAVCLWALTSPEEIVQRWMLRPVVKIDERAEDRDSVLSVRDAGLTEVAPGTVTATVQAPPGAVEAHLTSEEDL